MTDIGTAVTPLHGEADPSAPPGSEAARVATTVDDAAARAALAEVAPRLCALIRGIRDPSAHAVGEWSAGEVALHVAHAWEALSALRAGRAESPIRDVADLGGLTMAMVESDVDRDLDGIAARIEECAAGYVAAPPAAAALAPWLLEGVMAPPSTFACHILSESLVHGDDIARSQSMPWRIPREQAALALNGFILPIFAAIDTTALVDQEKARRLHACFDMRVRGGGRVFLVIDGGTLAVEQPSSRRVDCHISADPAALLLVLFGRRSQWPAILRGRMSSWGRRPWLAPRLRTVLRNP